MRLKAMSGCWVILMMMLSPAQAQVDYSMSLEQQIPLGELTARHPNWGDPDATRPGWGNPDATRPGWGDPDATRPGWGDPDRPNPPQGRPNRPNDHWNQKHDRPPYDWSNPRRRPNDLNAPFQHGRPDFFDPDWDRDGRPNWGGPDGRPDWGPERPHNVHPQMRPRPQPHHPARPGNPQGHRPPHQATRPWNYPRYGLNHGPYDYAGRPDAWRAPAYPFVLLPPPQPPYPNANWSKTPEVYWLNLPSGLILVSDYNWLAPVCSSPYYFWPDCPVHPLGPDFPDWIYNAPPPVY